MTADPLVLVAEVDRATDRLLDTVSTLAGDDATLASLLPGWTRGHVLTHLARSADALVNLLTWARTGVPVPAYASTAARDADIEAGAYRSIDELLADLRASAGRFAEAVGAMPPQAWSEVVQTRGGARVPAATLPWQRLRELEVHHVDLAAAYRPEDWSEAFVHRLLHEVVAGTSVPKMVLHATDLGHELTVGDPDGAPVVRGPGYALAAWLVGRRDGSDLTIVPSGPLPDPPRWL